MSRFLILTADDFGLHQAVNDAVALAGSEGVLTCASLMVGAPAAADAICKAHRVGRLRVGLHLVLTDGWSVLPHQEIPDLVDAERRFGDRMIRDGIRFFALPRVRRQIEAEVRAQFACFADSGLRLDHVNAHKHLQLHPSICRIILKVGAEFGLRAMRVPYEPLRHALHHGPRAVVGAALLMPWIATMRARLRAAAWMSNDQLFGISSTGRTDEQVLLRILSRLPEGVSEIYLHPALPSPAPITATMPEYRHADELRALMSPRVRSAIAAAGLSCGGYADCPAPPQCR